MGAIHLNVLRPPLSRGDGTYRICRDCPSSKNCCTRVAPNGEIDLPVLLPDDITRISKKTGMNSRDFVAPKIRSASLLSRLRSGDSGCVFYLEGRCAIYDIRPTDCRLFPFDILEKVDGSLVWVAYTDLCPVEHDPRTYFDEVKPLLVALLPYIREFARVEAPAMLTRPKIELGPVFA